MEGRERVVRMRMQVEGKEDVAEDVKALRAEKIGWIEEAIVNVYVNVQSRRCDLLIPVQQRICSIDHTLVVAEWCLVKRGRSFPGLHKHKHNR